MINDVGSSVLTYKKQPRYTNIDYREKLALCAQDLTNLRLLSFNLDEEEESNYHVVVQ